MWSAFARHIPHTPTRCGKYEGDKAFVVVGDGKMAVNMAYPQDCDEDDCLMPSRVDEHEELIEMVNDISNIVSRKMTARSDDTRISGNIPE
jgi:hypothetical protein